MRSLDLRRAIVEAYTTGRSGSYSETAALFWGWASNGWTDSTALSGNAFGRSSKQLISRCDTLTRELLDNAVARAMEAIKLQDILGWVSHAGYAVS